MGHEHHDNSIKQILINQSVNISEIDSRTEEQQHLQRAPSKSEKEAQRSLLTSKRKTRIEKGKQS
jgi:hypothetical protein